MFTDDVPPDLAHLAELPTDDGRNLLADLDDEFWEAADEADSDKLRRIGAPVWMWVKMDDAACCSDGLCAVCENAI